MKKRKSRFPIGCRERSDSIGDLARDLAIRFNLGNRDEVWDTLIDLTPGEAMAVLSAMLSISRTPDKQDRMRAYFIERG